MLEWTGERFVPWLDDAVIAYEHIHRYAYAARFVAGKRVLDMGSGEGYGAALLARCASEVVGIDIDPAAVEHAMQKYRRPNLSFHVASVAEVPLKGPFDVVVCYETLEHVESQRELVGEARRLLAPGGVFIVSTPEKRTYSEEPHLDNPFHTRELHFDEFRDLLAGEFEHVRFLGQRTISGSSLWPMGAAVSNNGVGEILVEKSGSGIRVSESGDRTAIYYVALASDSEALPAAAGSVLVDASNALLSEVHGIRSEFARLQTELRTTVSQRDEALRWKDERIESLERGLDWKDSQILSLRDGLRSLETEHTRVSDYSRHLENVIADQNRDLDQIRTELADSRWQVALIKSSRGWKVLERLRALRRKVTGDRQARDGGTL